MIETRHRPVGARSALRARVSPPSSQRGMSMTGVMALLAAAIFVGMFAITVGPAYMENLTINKIASNKMADESLRKAPRSKIYQSLNAAYRMNNLFDTRAEDTISLQKDKAGGFFMMVKYEKRANLFSNIDVVTRFEKEVRP